MKVIDENEVFVLQQDLGDGQVLLTSDTSTWLLRLSALQELEERQEIRLEEND